MQNLSHGHIVLLSTLEEVSRGLHEELTDRGSCKGLEQSILGLNTAMCDISAYRSWGPRLPTHQHRSEADTGTRRLPTLEANKTRAQRCPLGKQLSRRTYHHVSDFCCGLAFFYAAHSRDGNASELIRNGTEARPDQICTSSS